MPGHARELAGGLATAGQPLIVAVSGDGGLQRGGERRHGRRRLGGTWPPWPRVGTPTTTAAVPDGCRWLEAIVNAHVGGQARHLDLIRFWVDSGGAGWSQYAHSYVGFGLTPFMAVGLKRDQKGTIAELASVLRTFTDLAPVEIVRSNDRHELYDSLIFANVDRMAKYGLISNSGRPDDGPFRSGVLSACTPVADRADGAAGDNGRAGTTTARRPRRVRHRRCGSGPDRRRDLPPRTRVGDRHRLCPAGSGHRRLTAGRDDRSARPISRPTPIPATGRVPSPAGARPSPRCRDAAWSGD